MPTAIFQLQFLLNMSKNNLILNNKQLINFQEKNKFSLKLLNNLDLILKWLQTLLDKEKLVSSNTFLNIRKLEFPKLRKSLVGVLISLD